MDAKIDISFVVPAMKRKMKEESIGTLILAKKAQLAGYKVHINRYWDVAPSPKDDYLSFANEMILNILSKQPSIVSFYCRCEEYHICIDLAKKLKEKNSNIIIIFGGPQAELVAKETLRRFFFIDYICCSEGENTIVPFLTFLLKNECNTLSPSCIDGLTYRNAEGLVCQNQYPDFLKDNYKRIYNYYDLVPLDIIKKCESMPIDVGRGCPFSCTFCSTKTFWKRKFRLRDIEDTINEIELIVNNYGIKDFDFKHDLFTVNKSRIMNFCNILKAKNIHIKWGCDSRIGTIDKEMIDIMVENGLKRIFFGIETGSEKMQKIINKHLNLQEAEEIIKYCIDKGLIVTTSFIYGFPEETDEDLDSTMKMVVKFQNFGVNILTNLCHIMNGTELYRKYFFSLVLTHNIAYNTSIIAFNELYNLIAKNKEIFANFCDYPSSYRDEMKYFDVFRYALNYCLFNNLDNGLLKIRNDYGSLNMYKKFCQVNKDILSHSLSASNGDATNTRHILRNMPIETYQLLIDNLIK